MSIQKKAPIPDTVHIRLRSMRISSGLKQYEVARSIGVSNRTYSNYESGANPIPHDRLIKMNNNLHFSLHFLFFGKDIEVSKDEAMVNIRQNTQFNTRVDEGCLVIDLRVPLNKFIS